MRSILLIASVAATVFAPTTAPAQYYRRGPAWYDGPPPYVARGRAIYCQKLCNLDYSPCDPIEYKRADGRCTTPGTGRF